MDYRQKARIFRDRFYGRQDVYGPQWVSVKEDGTPIKGYNPACANIWKDKCHIKLKDGISCTDCEIKSFIPVSDETVLKHIRGEEPQMHYMLQPDGSIKFGAFDFDYKPGKEHLGYTFEDAQKVIAVLKEWGMPYGIARSTGNGFHIYFFLDDFYSARKFRSVMYEIMDRCGFMLENQNGIRPLPEMFPKQQYVGNGGLGNGIKPPMVEPQFSKERNCFVEDDGTMIPASRQWEHLDSIPKVKVKFLDDLIEKMNIPLEPEFNVAVKGRGGVRKSSSGPINGSIEKVIEGCAAFRKVRKNMEAGIVPGHFEGMALWHVAMNTLDGKDWFINNVPGWGKDSQGLRQLEHSVDKGYSPWTCKKMQDMGICAVGTKCFDKKPPIEYVDGSPVVKTDVPESEWPEPSPVRYAFGRGEDFLHKLLSEADLIPSIDDIAEKTQKIKEIISRAAVFDETQQAAIISHLEESKIAKKSEIKKWFAHARSDRDKKVTESVLERSDIFAVNGTIFKLRSPQGYAYLKPGGKKGEPQETDIANFFIDILEERTVIDDKKTRRKTYLGVFTGRNTRVEFDIDTSAWSDNGEFFSFFSKIGGLEFGAKKSDVDLIRLVVQHISQLGRAGVAPCKKSLFFGVQGWFEGAFLMPSVVIDKDGIKPNTERPVDTKHKEFAGHLDFKHLTEGDFREVMFHVKNDMLKAFPRDSVMLGLGFTMISSVHDYLNMKHRPTLWFDGTTGHGKSALAFLLQNFYGDFSNYITWALKPTKNSLVKYSHEFKDCLLLIDDYKGTDFKETESLISLVQGSYDGGVRSALDKTGEQKEVLMSRCLVMITGEDLPQNHASVIARTVTIPYQILDRETTKPYFNKCQEMKSMYSGITARFIHWVLNQTRGVLQKEFHDLFDDLMKPINGKQNASRVALNIAMALAGWNFFTRFMLDSGMVDATEAKRLVDEAWGYAEVIRDDMIERCAEQQGIKILLSRTAELLGSGDVTIKNLDGFCESPRGQEIGFVDKKDGSQSIIYIYPSKWIEIIKKNMSDHLPMTAHSAGAQLKEGGHLASIGTDGKTTVNKRHEGQIKRVWAIKTKSFGMTEQIHVVGHTQPMVIEQPIPDAQGLI
jgi:hypothetical protein